VHPAKTVDGSGRVTLDYAASVVQIGLAVVARVQTMRLETLTNTGTAQGKKKTVNEVAIRCIDATNFEYGRNFVDLIREEFTTLETPLDTALPLFNGDRVVNWPDEWGYESRLCLENDLPVPWGVAALFPQVETTQ
jgi:hypothetical protein